MDWETIYQSRQVTAEEAVQSIRSGDRIFLTGNCSVPRKLMAALVAYAPNVRNVEICQALTVAGSEYVSPEMEGHLRVNSLFISGNVRKAIQEGRADFTPVLLSEFPLLFRRDGPLPVDVAFVHCSPPDHHGYCTLGIEAGLTRTAAQAAKLIIAEVNQQMPRVHGDVLIHVSDLDYIVPVDYSLAELPMTEEGTEETRKIACMIAEHIPDGATLQTGIGEIPDQVLRYLTDKKDLGVHSELISDGVIDLVEAGVITGARKKINPGKIVGGFMLGTHRLYEWADDFPMIELHCTEYVNSPFIIAQNPRVVAMNSALEVDLTGQIAADSIGPKLYSGVGGQLDFIYGAGLSEGGLPIIALPSTITLRDGTRLSRITPMLKLGAGVTTTRNHVHYVVTEFGMVDLYGKTIRQRAQALISIAHPDFRADLICQAKALHYL